MRMTALIDGHAVQRQSKVNTVIQINATQKILISFTFTTVLTDDQSWHNFKDLTRTSHHARIDLRLSDSPFIRSIGRTQQTVTRTKHLDSRQTTNVITPCHRRNTQN